MLIRHVSRGGNLIMNVGPTARGYFDDRAMARLEAFAKWMGRNARSIYGCTMAPEEFPEANGTRYTWNPKTRRLYVHIFDWPFQRLHLAGLAGKVAYAQFLHDGSEIGYAENGKISWNNEDLPEGTLTLLLPVVQPDILVPTVELFLQ
jgi:alpha-L-fucosidase